ncbi:hypothetical protein NBRC10512_000418 [Rhodotorula toruloides]|uniref:Serine/threonine-protein kinase Tel1 n=2 Tax=Rhodotorula toruloides TaxID=5286 RepID=A0A061AYP8_RHOTO|nr:protein serine/threonine kinase,ataxia telangectasia mutated family protein [Rhodotorula toruloides NP11]EMS19186.1 protein serine/threonine kinase,ataxia telangectasia mutated family protein [Rhodotorula toruloides NP11]CDR39865.1 RHTO0S04e11122g1_1 [Rhodotorula toruloides]
MSASRDFQEIVFKLESDKIKERAEGVSRLREFLASKRNFNAINRDPSHSWNQTLQTLFGVVIKERNAAVSKKSAATDKRLDDATQAVRWLVEKIHQSATRKVAKAIIAHLTQMTAVAGKLQPYALTYMKALRTILSYPPHLEHLDERQWTDIVMLGFSGVLGDKIKIGQEFVDDAVMDIDEDERMGGALRASPEEELFLPTPAAGKARRTANPVEIELLAVVEVAFRSRSSPFLLYAQAIFRKFLRFFDAFPSETTAHVSALTALNRAFAEVDLNDQRSMRRIGPRLWKHILGLWATKSTTLKEQVVMALRYLFPFVIPATSTGGDEVSIARAKALYHAVLTEPTIRWREPYDIDIDHLRLGLVLPTPAKPQPDEPRSKAYHAQTFRIGTGFDEKHAVAWGVVELGADALARIYEVEDAQRENRAVEAMLSPTQRGKRRKIEDPLSVLLDSLSEASLSNAAVAFRLQLLLFLVDRHWSSLDSEACRRILDALIPVLSHLGTDVARWAFLAVAAIAHAGLPVEHTDELFSPISAGRRKRQQSAPSSPWEQIWLVALRKLATPETCRAAAHAANILLAHDRVSGLLLSESIEAFARDLDLQSVNFPSDAVCMFLEWTLAISASDARLVRLGLSAKVVGWVTMAWSALDGMHRAHSFGQARPHADPLSNSALVSLIARLSGISAIPPLPHDYVVPDCPIATMAVELSETYRIRDFLEAKLPAYVKDDTVIDTSIRTPAYFDATGGAPEDLEHTMPRKVSIWLRRVLEGLKSGAAEQGDPYWTGMASDPARRHLDLACLALVVEGVFATNRIPSDKATVRAACEILALLAPTLTLKKWLPDERAYLLGSLSPILVEMPLKPDVDYPVLLDPGIASDLPQDVLPRRKPPSAELDLEGDGIVLLRAIWKGDTSRQALEEILAALRFLLLEVTATDPNGSSKETAGSAFALSQTPSTQASERIKELEQTQNGDGFDDVKYGSSRVVQVGSTGAATAPRAGAATVAMCVKGFVSAEMAYAGTVRPVRIQEVVDAILQSDGEESIVIAEQALAAVHAGLATFSLAQAQDILQHIGGELLPDYRYARNDEFATLAIKFLECTTDHWVVVGEANEDFAGNARVLCSWIITSLRDKKVPSWRVRLKFLAFLDRYIQLDQAQEHWDFRGSAPRSEDGHIISPTSIIPFMLSDADFRVRFRATTSTAELFNVCTALGVPVNDLFDDIRANTTPDVSQLEQTLTQLLSSANLVVAAGSRRRSPYHLILELAGGASETTAIALVTLDGVAKRIGMASPADLYLAFARYIAWKAVRDAGNQPNAEIAHRLPYRACGFPTLRDARKADFVKTASWLIQFGDPPEAFLTLCEILKRSPQEGRLDCFADSAALAICRFHARRAEDESPGYAELEQLLARLAEGAGASDAHQQGELLASTIDALVAEILAQTYEERWAADEPLPVFSHDKQASELFAELLRLPEDLVFQVETASPHWKCRVTVPASLWVDSHYRVFCTPSAVFSVVQNLLSRVHRAPFVSEKRRHLLNLALAIALSHSCVHRPAILASIVDGLASLLACTDTFVLVGPMLRWALKSSLDATSKGDGPAFRQRLVEQLVRVAHAASSLRAKLVDPQLVVITQSLSKALDQGIRHLSKVGGTHLAEAALLWPHEVFSYASLSPPAVLDAIASSFAPVDKFDTIATIRRLPQYDALASGAEGPRLAWHLMQALKPGTAPRSSDSLAFAELLFDIGGEAERPAVDDPAVAHAEVADVAVPDNDRGIKKLVVDRLLAILHGAVDPKLADAAMATARLALSVPDVVGLCASSHPVNQQTAIVAQIISNPALARVHRTRTREARSLVELGSDEWLKRAQVPDKWVTAFAELLADVRAEGDDFYAQLVPLIRFSPTFSTQIIPSLVHSLLLRSAISGDEDMEKRLSTYVERLLSSTSAGRAVVRLIVDTAVYLRKHAHPNLQATSRSRCDTWLKLPWLLLAEGAVKIGSWYTALLFLELAHEYDRLFTRNAKGQVFDQRLDDRAQVLLYEVYAGIDEPDGFYGRESLDTREALLRRYRHEGQWAEAFKIYGARREAQSHHFGTSDPAATAGVITSLASFGFNRLALSLYQPARLDGSIGETDVAAGLPYDLGWRTDVWDLPLEDRALGSSSVSLYTALRTARTGRDTADARQSATDALVKEVAKLGAVSLDLPQPRCSTVSAILALREVVRLSSIGDGGVLTEDLVDTLTSVPKKLGFEHAERILTTRISLLRGIRAKERVEQVGDEFSSALYKSANATEQACLLELSRVGRRSGQLQVALNSVTVAHTLAENGRASQVDEELANVLWAQGEHRAAISLLTTVHEGFPQKSAALYARLGDWTADARIRDPKEILDEYFDPAIRALDRNAPGEERAQVHHAVAAFADAQYGDLSVVAIERRRRLNAYQQRKELEFLEIDRQLQSGSTNSAPYAQSKKDAEHHIEEDRRQVEDAEETARTMLWRALDNYAQALQASDEFDDSVFRFCALWLACADNAEIHTALKPRLAAISSHKFVFLAYQLSARLTKPSQPTPATQNIRSLVQRLCNEHPFHTLYPVNALRDSNGSRSSRRSSASRESSIGAGGSASKSTNSRAQAANDIVEKAKRLDGLRHRIEAVELACAAYAEWASFDIKRNSAYQDSRGAIKKGPQPIPRSMQLKAKVVNLPIPVTTFDLPVDPTGTYSDESFPHIVGYDDHFDTAGGIHVPKIVTCVGSDGKRYKQLLKGDDDIRQDAVMEQAFQLVNSLLARDDAGRRRKLRIRTYKVVPLQNRNGLIEFVANTEPLGNFLARLYDEMAPGLPKQAREKLRSIEAKHKGRHDQRDAEKTDAFKKILDKMPPLMRFLFWQRHKVPSLWFDMRLNYSRSVATTSIIGHIVGLGDRHVSNILMDVSKGELVHIDLGIAFDQGKRLPIPEKVPFRLTQNMIDGFGMSGVDGVFRRCCEETLRVLRNRSNIVMTVLEVFKHDPLQSWAVSADMAKRIQGSDDGDAAALDDLPDDADRALSIVRNKLDTRLSVEYRVNELIQEATNPSNLATIFSGWQPYL